MSLGLKRGIVQLESHDKQWDEAAIQTIKILKSILGDDAIDIQHIGSTAILGIKAKPIIDIAIVYRKDDIEEKWVVVPDGVTFSKEEIRRQIHFQEQYFDSEIVM